MDIQELTAESFSSFGKVLNRAPFVDLDPSEEFSWADGCGDLDLFTPSCTGQLNCRYRERDLRKMERHMKTPEIMVALEGDSLICVASASEDAPQKESIRCFRVKQGSALLMDKAVWHWIPYPEQEPGSKFLVLFRDGTGADDLNFHELEEPFRV